MRASGVTQFYVLLDRITMQRITLVALAGMFAWAVLLSALRVLDYSPVDIGGAAVIAVAVAVTVNTVFARALRATTDLHSTLITALIVAFLVPVGLKEHGTFLVAASAVAAASKYIVTVDRQHIFNPAALAVAALALLFPQLTATWWIGTAWMLPAVAVYGGLVVLKTRRARVVVTFLVIYSLITTGVLVSNHLSAEQVLEVLRLDYVHTAVIFFAFIMLTDPVTVPSRRYLRAAYIGLVAVLYASPQIRFLPAGFTPEQALCLANAASFGVRPKFRLDLRILSVRRTGSDIWQFGFSRPPRFAFAPGQYMEWTVPHHGPDSRGPRRYFTIASSPAEDELAVVMRVPDRCSSYKRALVGQNPGLKIVAARLAGDFVLPGDTSVKLALIAGGVGIAPFRSMVRDMLDTGTRRDAVLIYTNGDAEDILFQDVFERASGLGLRTVYTLTRGENAPAGWHGRLGRCNAQMLREAVPDFRERTFFVSGSQKMVSSVFEELRSLGVPRSRIHTDYFDGSSDAL